MSCWSIAALIPTYNRASLLPRALDSVLCQRRPPDEIIVVDDGSTDETFEVLAAYGDNVTVVRGPHRGASAARNAGVRRARSDFIAFLDSDDVWDEGHLRRVARAIEATDGRASLYFSNLGLPAWLGDRTVWDAAGVQLRTAHDLQADGRPWLFLATHPMTIPASVVKREAFLELGGFNEELVCREDTHFFFRIGLSGEPVCAVAGKAGDLVGDGPESLFRQTYADREAYYSCTVLLYADVLQRTDGSLDSEQRRMLARQLAEAHLQLARACGLRSPRGTAYHVWHVVRNAPLMPAERVLRRLRRSTSRAPEREEAMFDSFIRTSTTGDRGLEEASALRPTAES